MRVALCQGYCSERRFEVGAHGDRPDALIHHLVEYLFSICVKIREVQVGVYVYVVEHVSLFAKIAVSLGLYFLL